MSPPNNGAINARAAGDEPGEETPKLNQACKADPNPALI
jgi:hypothetical protein